jgi:hypothetical protein
MNFTMENAMERKNRVPLSVRISPELRDQMEKAAQQSERSLTQETELRLQLSFAADRHLMDALALAFGEPLSALLLLIGRVMNTTGRSAGFSATNTLEGAEDWVSNGFAYDQAVEAANAILEAARPEGDAASSAFLSGLDLGVGMAMPYLTAVADPNAGITANLQRIGRETRERLGDEVADRIARSIRRPFHNL